MKDHVQKREAIASAEKLLRSVPRVAVLQLGSVQYSG
jgi:hypothetical protein